MNGFNKIHLMGEVLGFTHNLRRKATLIKLHVDCDHEELMPVEVPLILDIKKGSAIYVDGKMKSGICLADNIALLSSTGNTTLYSRFK